MLLYFPRICLYTQNLILVILILVNFVGFLVITRDHGSFEGRHSVEIFPTGLPELFKPSRDLLELRKTELFRDKKLKKPIFLTSVKFLA